MSKISFVYFDVGGVVIKDFSDSPKWAELRKYLNITKDQFAEFESIYGAHVHDVAMGKEHVDIVVSIARDQLKLPIPPDFSLQTYFLDNFEINDGVWPIIHEAKKQFHIGLLTDMFPGLFDGIKQHNLFPPNINWDVTIDSSVVGFHKPMPEIYELSRVRAGVPPQEILFIDNREKNLVPARKLGWKTFLYDSSNYDQANSDLYATILSC